MDREPIVTVATIAAAIGALLTLLVAFGVPLTEDQQQAILGAAVVVAPIVVALVARRWTVPLAGLREYTDRVPAERVVAYEAPSGVVVAGKAYLDDGTGEDVYEGTPVSVEPIDAVPDADLDDAGLDGVPEPPGFDDGSDPALRG